VTKELHGGEPATTNNRMELMAAIQGLESLTRPAEVTIWTDSTYVKNGITTWVKNWQRNSWRTADKKPVKNEDLWRLLVELDNRYKPTWRWVKGHAGDPGNERADELARQGAVESLAGR